MSWTPGARIDRYVLGPQLGAGAMGAVFLANDADTGQRYALKALSLADASPEAVARFEREGQAQAAAGGHPNVARVRGTGQAFGRAYLVLDLLPGGSLEERLRGGPLEPEAAARLLVELAAGLAHVHARGVLHRDLKPSNVMFDAEGTPQLVDFGVSRLAGVERLTRTGDLVGTPAYMPPEQLDGDSGIDERADVYGLGAILYHCLSGRPPYEGEMLSIARQVTLEPVPRLEPPVPPELERICHQAMAKDPAQRYPTAEALSADLERFLAGEQVEAPSVAGSRLLLLAPLLLGALLLLVGGGVWLAARSGDAAAPATGPTGAAGPTLAIELQAPATASAERLSLAGRVTPDVEAVRVEAGGRRWRVTPRGGALALELRLAFGANHVRLTPLGGRGVAGRPLELSIERVIRWTAPRQGCARDPSLVLLRVPSGGETFTMGSTVRPGWYPRDGWARERHDTRRVRFRRDVYLGRTEVTWAEYRRFCQATGREAPSSEVRFGELVHRPREADLPRLPVYNVTWADAAAFCAWVTPGGRLPTEAEWEFAARGVKGQVFPWGNMVRPIDGPVANLTTDEAIKGVTFDPEEWACAVDAFPKGASPFGLLGMGGNVREWTQDWFGPYLDPPTPGAALIDPVRRAPFERLQRRITRGADFRRGPNRAMAWHRNPHDPRERSPEVGFRVAHDAE